MEWVTYEEANLGFVIFFFAFYHSKSAFFTIPLGNILSFSDHLKQMKVVVLGWFLESNAWNFLHSSGNCEEESAFVGARAFFNMMNHMRTFIYHTIIYKDQH